MQRNQLREAQPQMDTKRREAAAVAMRRVDGPAEAGAADVVATEEPLEIQLEFGPREKREVRSISVTMRTPGHDFELAAGFLMTEGILRDSADIDAIAYAASAAPALDGSTITPALASASGPNTVRVTLAEGVMFNMNSLQRNFYTTSGCGICGKASLLALGTVCPPRRKNEFRIAASVLTALPDTLRAAQTLFAETGGVHGAALFDASGTLRIVREDVGRHNAVDKLMGAEFLADRTPLHGMGLLLSGRASFELLQKAVMGGVGLVAAVGAPSSLAVETARHFDVTLVGFLRGQRFNLYSGAERVAP